MPDRLLPVSTTPGAITGNAYMDAVQDEVTGLWNAAVITLTAVAGTNAITATPAPALTGALVDGMNFILSPLNTNTSTTVTLDVGTGAKPVVDRDGNAPSVGQIKNTGSYLLTWVAALTKFKVLTYLPPTTTFSDRPSWRNALIGNGGFDVWQRGAGSNASIAVFASTTAYTADRWYMTTGASQACTASAQAGIDAAGRSQLAGRFQRNNAQTGVSAIVVAYPLTASECIRLRGNKISLQFLAKAGASFSPASGTLTYNVFFGTGSEGRRGAGFTAETNPITGTINLTPGGAVQALTATSAAAVATNVTQGEVRFSWVPVGTASTTDYVDLDNVQLEVANSATEFEYAPFEVMLRQCEAHYAKTFAYGTAAAQNAGRVNALTTDKDLKAFATYINNFMTANGFGSFLINTPTAFGTTLFWRFPSRMRTTPTIVTYNPSAAATSFNFVTGNNGASANATATVSPDTSTGDSGVTIVGDGGTTDLSQNLSSITATKNLIGYIHASADASL